jgi:hypothetical protein
MLKELLIEKTPKYTDVLPLSQKRVTYRPFLVREEKTLLIASETSSFENLMSTVRDVVNSCVEGLPSNDCKDLPFCDLEYLFMKIREKSVGEVVDCEITCPVTNEKVTTTLDLSKIELSNKKPQNKIKIDSNITVVMQQPSMETYLTLNKYAISAEEESVIELLALCVKEIHSDSGVYSTKDLPKQETKEFIETLTAKQFAMFIKYLKEIPVIQTQIKYTTSDNVEREITLRGFSDFLELFLVMRI